MSFNTIHEFKLNVFWEMADSIYFEIALHIPNKQSLKGRIIAQSSHRIIVKLKVPIVFWLFEEKDITYSTMIASHNHYFLIDGGNRQEGR